MRFPAASSELDIARQMRNAELAENESSEDGADDSAKSAENAVVLRLRLRRSHDENRVWVLVLRVVVFGHIVPSCCYCDLLNAVEA